MTKIAVLTPAADDGTYGPHWPQVLERLGAALATVDVTVVPTSWSDHVEDCRRLLDYPLVLSVLTWGYHQRHSDWLKALAVWETAGVRIANPASVLAWNSDKAYLKRLEAAGVAIPPTLWTDRVTPDQVEAAFARFGTDTLIVKPTVSAGAWKTTKVSRGEALIDPPPGAAMIQPFLPELVAEGELSLLFFGGRFSHAVNKTAKAGDFRIQSQYGGRYQTVGEPPAAALALAERVLGAIKEPLLYARIDMVQASDSRWLLMEAELIEPDFYLSEAPDRGLLFAEAVRARLDEG
ncbi:ATP-grasp domain-containing protein [Brevundimonas aurifodinae]|uniref:Transporter n=2 Tax=Brevundimonas TaxID=41275 RepID=A0ABV1NIK5_9CAUL|nr:MAG: transporter [Brevundimonas sp. 12-68-7]OYX35690.1 MAG: transporter [Brevundimonas subvibrioides]